MSTYRFDAAGVSYEIEACNDQLALACAVHVAQEPVAVLRHDLAGWAPVTMPVGLAGTVLGLLHDMRGAQR